MRRLKFLSQAVMLVLSGYMGPSLAAEVCIDSVDGVQMVAEAGGALALYAYSKELATLLGNANAYFYYSGQSDAAKAFHAQFLFAKAAGNKLCIGYVPGTPSYRLVLVSVGIANEDAWPWQ